MKAWVSPPRNKPSPAAVLSEDAELPKESQRKEYRKVVINVIEGHVTSYRNEDYSRVFLYMSVSVIFC